MSENPIHVFDFTIPADGDNAVSFDTLKTWLAAQCKKWVFQKEQGEETGFLHWQGRISLKTKVRLGTLINKAKALHAHWSITHDHENEFYVTKEETRVEGPWSDRDPVPPYIPRDVRDITTWRPWQQRFETLSEIYESRKVYILYDHIGNNGKSTIIRKLCVYGKMRQISYGGNFRDLLRMVMDMPKCGAYVVDLPRAIGKEFDKGKLCEFWGAVEAIKTGYAYDDRFHFKDEYFDPPVLWVITNRWPDTSMLSADRWKMFHIENDELIEGATNFDVD